MLEAAMVFANDGIRGSDVAFASEPSVTNLHISLQARDSRRLGWRSVTQRQPEYVGLRCTNLLCLMTRIGYARRDCFGEERMGHGQNPGMRSAQEHCHLDTALAGVEHIREG